MVYGFQGLGLRVRDVTPITEKQMEKNMGRKWRLGLYSG